MTTTFTTIRKWRDDEDNPGDWPNPDEWPYPTEFIKSRIDGELADKIRAKFGETAEVFMTEQAVSGGYSEYTTEIEYSFVIECGASSKDFDWAAYNGQHDGPNGLVKLLQWIDSGDEPEVAELIAAEDAKWRVSGGWWGGVAPGLYEKARDVVKAAEAKLLARYSHPDESITEY